MIAELTLVAAIAACESLASLKLQNTTITIAQPVEAGQFTAPEGRGGRGPSTNPFQRLPAFCRVAATLTPTSDSDIKVEVWLPLTGWNGKYQALGNGGWAGTISYPAMAEALRRGYATSSTDTGHSTPGGAFALGHPEKFTDFAWRSVHEMAVASKAIINAFYATAPRYSYWNGCSTGGRQGLSEAQRFPQDFDGIIAGAAANPRTHLGAWHMTIGLATLKDPASYVPPAMYPVIHKAVVDKCDALDGVKDGLISNPPACKFDPSVLACGTGGGGEAGGASGSGCLTAPQVEAVGKMMSPLKNPRTGEEIFPGWEPGSELGWGVLATGPDPVAVTLDHFKYVVFADPKWDWRTFDVERDLARAVKVDNNTVNAIDPNLTRFQSRGGKLLLYHGWSDPNVAPQATIRYYDSVVKAMGGAQKTSDWMRLFMVPGMGHCGGGEGPNSFDMVTTLEQWVEKGAAPSRIVASRVSDGKVERARPLCPYPQVAIYNGSGSTDDAANFSCR
jgi:Tannase and feruloyl esterase